jgi:DNA-binding phage protein
MSTASTTLTELRTCLDIGATRCRAMRWFGALFHVSVAQDIAAEVAEAQTAMARDAEAARGDNEAAVALLERAMRERNHALVSQAMKRIRKSASRMQKISENLTGAACMALFAAGICAALWAAASGDTELRTVRRTTRRRDELAEVA